MGYNVNEENNYMRVHFLPPENRMRWLKEEAGCLPSTEGRVPSRKGSVMRAPSGPDDVVVHALLATPSPLTQAEPPPPPSTR